MRILRGHTKNICCLAFSPDGRWLASGGEDGLVCVWRLETGDPVLARQIPNQEGKSTLPTGESWVRALAFSPDSAALASARADGDVHLQSLSEGEREISWRPDHGIWSLAFAPDGKTIAAGGGSGQLALLPLQGQKGRQTLSLHTNLVLALAYSPDGKLLASGGSDRTVRL